MKHQVIENPRLTGCLCCSNIPKVKLPKNTSLYMGFGFVSLTINDKHIWGSMTKDRNVNWLERRYSHKLANSKGKAVLLKFDMPLRDETYEYNLKDGEWYLVHQGIGFA